MKYGFIGCGNMGGAVARAVCKGAGAGDVLLANRTPAKAQALAGELGCACGTNEQVASICDFIFLGVKPQMMADMLDELAPTLEARAESRPFVLVSMAAGLSMQQIRHMAGSGYPIIRMMPNTPVALGAGMIQYCCDDVEPAQLQEWLAAMQPAGRLDEVPETLIDAASAVSGCGPAWVYQFIEALADGGVAAGLPRAKAQEYAAQMVLGSARMVLESGSHPGALKDAVCSPGGSTIQGVRLLEERAFRGAVTDYFAARVNETADAVPRDESSLFAVEKTEILQSCTGLYTPLLERWPFLDGPERHPKPAVYSKLMSAWGFTGYLCPLVGESTLNVDSPAVFLPVTVAHELAHQRGVAAEQDANFVGVMAATAGGNAAYQYSGWLFGYLHLSNALYSADPDLARASYAALCAEAQADMADNNAYWKQWEGPVKETGEKVYTAFLQGYGQKLGMRSYGACVDLLVEEFLPYTTTGGLTAE